MRHFLINSDIDPSSFHCVLLGEPRNRVQSTQVVATLIENLDFSM